MRTAVMSELTAEGLRISRHLPQPPLSSLSSRPQHVASSPRRAPRFAEAAPVSHRLSPYAAPPCSLGSCGAYHGEYAYLYISHGWSVVASQPAPLQSQKCDPRRPDAHGDTRDSVTGLTVGVDTTLTPTGEKKVVAFCGVDSTVERLLETAVAASADAVTTLAVMTTDPAETVTVTAEVDTLDSAARMASMLLMSLAVKSLTVPAADIDSAAASSAATATVLIAAAATRAGVSRVAVPRAAAVTAAATREA
eukprot:7347131-Prymnesium_polylepis.1